MTPAPSATLHQPGAALSSLDPGSQPPNSLSDQQAAPLSTSHRVATAGSRSASLPFNLQMGLSQSKPAHPPPLPPSSTPAKGLSTTVSNGLKRTFARRRKNSEDASKVFAARGMEQHDGKLRAGVSAPSLAPGTPPPMAAAQRSTPPRIETRPHPVSGHNIIRSPLQCPPTPPKKDTPAPVHVQSDSEPPAAGSRSSVMTNITEITSAVNFITLMDEQQEQQAKGDGEGAKASDKPETKENWRKSDSTNSHHTVRAAARASRPVSWADSLQSTHTLMPQANKRRSALIGDADFGMAEEDDEDGSASSHSHAAAAANTSPTASTRSLHRRSMSLNLGSSTSSTAPQPQSFIPALDMRYAHSVSEGVPPFGAGFTLRGGPAAGTPTPPTPTAQPNPQAPAASNLRGRLAAWSAAAGNTYITPSSPAPHPPSSLLSQPHSQPLLQPQPPAAHARTPSPAAPSSSPSSFRQTAISIGVGSAAASIARRTVDKIGRKWAQGMGMGLSASSSGSGGAGAWSSSSSASVNEPASLSGTSHSYSHLGEVLVRTSSNLSMGTQNTSFFSPSHGRGAGAGGHKRTPASGASGAGSVSSASMASGSNSDSDFFAPSGPVLGVRLRGALRGSGRIGGAGGLVFGRNLAAGVRDTGVHVGGGVGGKRREGLAGVFEERALAAVVVRCAQHLVLWGVQEEGLFRVPGRSAHVAKLRAEFDSGADYDMEAASLGDLDPHAVASVFKAYLRELPEPILTQKLQPLFDEAITKEASKNATDASSSADTTNTSTTRLGAGARGAQGLPSNPKSGFTAGLRKPPSLSTLAMPSFTGIPPASPALVSAIRALVARLPTENRDLLLTVVDLIKETAKQSKETKMPLSNLLVVFCPSLAMTPPLLKTLCEVGGGWAGEGAGVIDIRRHEADADDASASSEDARSRLGDEADSVASSRPSLDGPSSDYHGSAEGSSIRDGAVPRVLRADFAREVPTVYLDTRSHMSAGSSVPSLLQQDNGSISSSGGGGGGGGYAYAYAAPLSGSSPPPLSSSSESVVTPTSSGNPSFTDLQLHSTAATGKDQEAQHLGMQHAHHNGSGPLIFDALELHQHAVQGKRAAYGGRPGPLATPVSVPFPVDSPPTPSSATKRRSIPMLSLPVMTPLSPSTQPPSAQPSPSEPPRTLRGKKPSLKLLFSKRSVSSLNGTAAAARGLGIISPPVLLAQQGSPRSGTGSGSDSSSLSVSTPLSAVTAPTGAGSASASTAQLPPVLDTPIERAEFGMDLGFELSPPPTAMPDDMRPRKEGSRASPRVRGSPYGVRDEREDRATQPLARDGTRRTIKPGENHIRPQASSSNLSLASSHHLSLFEDDGSDEGMEGWTQSVLLAADVDGKWVVQKPGGGSA